MFKVIKVLEEVVLNKGWKRTIKGGFSLNINNLHYSSVLHSHKVLMK